MDKKTVVELLDILTSTLCRAQREYDRILNFNDCSEIDRAHFFGIKKGFQMSIDTIQFELDELMEDSK